jgi:hypothetical protein
LRRHFLLVAEQARSDGAEQRRRRQPALTSLQISKDGFPVRLGGSHRRAYPKASVGVHQNLAKFGLIELA